MYQVKFNDITSMHGQTNQTIQQWGESLKNLQDSIASLANQSELQGKAMTSAKSYMTEVHGTFIQTLTQLMNEYIVSFLLYKDGYYQIDTHNHAELPEDVYKGLHSDLGKSKQRFEQQLEQLTTAKLRVAGLVNYQGTSHTKTKFTYEKLMKDIKHLDESITQYEEMHARQDLQAFKELLAATKSLLAEHSSRDRSMGSYQVGDFRQLPSMNRFMLAAQQSAIYLNNHMPQFQAAGDREQVRIDTLRAEERTKEGAMNLFFGILTLAVGLSALVISGGTAIPIVTPWLKFSGSIMYFLGGSNAWEGVQNISLGLRGDGQTHAINPLRDTIFMGDVQTYNSVVQVVSLTTGILIPIAHTQSILQGTWQFGWGLFGGHTFGKIGYHGTKLLGGSEEMAQMMDLFGNLIGGYTFSKLTQDFSLNRIQVPKVSAEKVQIQEPELLKSSIKNMSDEVYTEIRKMSVKNPESDTMTLGKYEPTIRPDGTKDYRTPGPNSYIKKAGKTTYFDLGEYWNEIMEKYHLDNEQMFEKFNKPALDDAVAQGKTIRFSHDPELPQYKDSAIKWEWDYLKEQHGYKRLTLKGGYWYGVN